MQRISEAPEVPFMTAPQLLFSCVGRVQCVGLCALRCFSLKWRVHKLKQKGLSNDLVKPARKHKRTPRRAKGSGPSSPAPHVHEKVLRGLTKDLERLAVLFPCDPKSCYTPKRRAGFSQSVDDGSSLSMACRERPWCAWSHVNKTLVRILFKNHDVGPPNVKEASSVPRVVELG